MPGQGAQNIRRVPGEAKRAQFDKRDRVRHHELSQGESGRQLFQAVLCWTAGSQYK